MLNNGFLGMSECHFKKEKTPPWIQNRSLLNLKPNETG
jgi:hypothetical protein